jgi:hypothetical protein
MPFILSVQLFSTAMIPIKKELNGCEKYKIFHFRCNLKDKIELLSQKPKPAYYPKIP